MVSTRDFPYLVSQLRMSRKVEFCEVPYLVTRVTETRDRLS